MVMNAGEAARLAKAKREKAAHDAKADTLNKTTYSKPETETITDSRGIDWNALRNKNKKKPAPTAGDAANALARRKKE